MKIWLAYISNHEGAEDQFTSLLPVGLVTINNVLLEAGFDSLILNFSKMTSKEILSLLKTQKPAIVGLSQFTHNRFETIDLARMIKTESPDSLIILGGTHATHRASAILKFYSCVDVVVLGEGEMSMLEIVTTVANGENGLSKVHGIAFISSSGNIKFTPKRSPEQNINSLGITTARKIKTVGTDLRRQLEFIITSRGCPASCSFCSSPNFWGKKIRYRFPDSIIKEIRTIRDVYGLIYFSIRDDTFTSNRERVIEFCRKLIDERLFILWNCQSRVNALDPEMLLWMRRAGCDCIQLGIESGSAKILKQLGKGISSQQIYNAASYIREAGIPFSVYLITGVESEEASDVSDTCRLIETISPADGQVSPLAYYPGTHLFESAVKKGTVSSDMFERSKENACLVRNDAFVRNSTKSILSTLARTGRKAGSNDSEFLRLKATHGYCHANSVARGEMLMDKGKLLAAKQEFLEITEREPDNPWGWLCMGELFQVTGEFARSLKCFEKLCSLVPAHQPGYELLAEICEMRGDKKNARNYSEIAKNLS